MILTDREMVFDELKELRDSLMQSKKIKLLFDYIKCLVEINHKYEESLMLISHRGKGEGTEQYYNAEWLKDEAQFSLEEAFEIEKKIRELEDKLG